ncbi:MAG TPA: hypothetical protein VMD47_02380, partial [Candidatus Acidoferrales bacterium]|nr:hypothetical protein [Candidatus Acidoferrales bacterium]
MSGFSISNNLLANEVNLDLSEHQQSLGTSVRDLSSGLRVNDAADDPSGYAIATSLQTHAQAFGQASQNVSDAQNAATVADGALAAVTDILLRIRELAVGAASSVDSTSDREDIQAEIGQLLAEINRIAQDTNFNGRSLLDGSIAGNQSGQNATATITSNSILFSNGANTASAATANSNLLLASTVLVDHAQFPPIDATLQQAAAAGVDTVSVSDAGYIQPGMTFQSGNVLVDVQAVDAAAGTITASFSGALASGAEIHAYVIGTITGPISVGQQLVTVANGLGGNAVALYAGEVLQINAVTLASNDVVVVQKVVSPDSFVATFNKAQPAGVSVYSINWENVGTSGNGSYNFTPGPADSSPDGSPVYVEEYSGAFAANTGKTQVVEVGRVTDSTPTIENFSLPGNPTNEFAGGNFIALSALGDGNVPVVSTVDGTIELQVIDDNGTAAVQETFYGTASQTSTTSAFLLAPGERAELFDGIVTTLGNFSLADVGSTAYIKVLQAVQAPTSNPGPLVVQSGSDEGDVVQIGIPAVNTNTLRISATTVIGASGGDPTLAAEDAIGQMDYALQQVTTIRAQLGASIVRLGIDQSNDDTAATELTASQSNI